MCYVLHMKIFIRPSGNIFTGLPEAYPAKIPVQKKYGTAQKNIYIA